MYITSIFFSINLFLYSDKIFAKSTNKVTDDVLLISNSKAWKPFSYIENGQPKGLLIDFWRHYSEVSGKKVKFELTNWQDSLDNVSKGKADLHAGLLYSPKRDKLLDFGSRIFSLKASLYINKNLIHTFDDIAKLRTPVGVVTGGYEQEYLQKNYPDITLIGFANNGLLFDALTSKVMESFVADSQVANFYLINHANENQYIPLQTLYEKPIRFAVKAGNQTLLDFVEKGIGNVSQSDISRIQQKWLNTETSLPNWLHQVLFFAVIIFIFSYIYMFKRLVIHRTSALASAIEELKIQANTDPLTALFNRRYFMEEIGLREASLRHDSFAMLMLDIDYFKKINDDYGHHVGDQILIVIARRFSANLKDEDLLARIGGEEFCIILDNVSYEQALIISKKINNAISLQACKYEEGMIDVSISIGCSFIQKNQHWQAELALKHADELLYQAKEGGRNQTAIAVFS